MLTSKYTVTYLLVIPVWGYTKHEGTHITVTPRLIHKSYPSHGGL